MTWMRRMEGVRIFDRSGRSDAEVAAEIAAAACHESDARCGARPL